MQKFKSISFTDKRNNKSKVVPIAFTEKEQNLYTLVNKLSSQEIRNIIGYSDYSELCVAAEQDKRNVSQFIKFLLDKALQKNDGIIAASDVTFKSSKTIPFNRWYPYIEGYSPDFVKTIINKYIPNKCIIYEPFAGTGTTIFASGSMGYRTYYSEINPLLQFLIKTKLNVLKTTNDERDIVCHNLITLMDEFLGFNHIINNELEENYKRVIKSSIYFPDENYNEILKVKTFIDSKAESLTRDIFTIAILACLIPSSFLKKQGDLRFKTKKELEKGIPKFSDILNDKINEIYNDLKFELVNNVAYNHQIHRLI